MRPSIKAPSWVYSSVFNIPACAISPSILAGKGCGPLDAGDALYDLTDTAQGYSTTLESVSELPYGFKGGSAPSATVMREVPG